MVGLCWVALLRGSHQVRPELCGGSQAIMVEKKEKKAGAGGGGMNSMGMNPNGMPAGLTM